MVSGLKTLGGIKTFDDIVSPEERQIISDLEKKINKKQTKVCPFLAKEGKFFYYCKKGLSESDLEDKKPSSSNRIYHGYTSVIEMKKFCLNSYKTCEFYFGTLRH